MRRFDGELFAVTVIIVVLFAVNVWLLSIAGSVT